MPRMGRPRIRNKDLPPGVRLISGRYYWSPTSARERADRRAQGLPMTVPLGAEKTAMRKEWVQIAGIIEAPPADHGTVAELLNLYLEEGLDQRKTDGSHKLSETTRHEYKRQVERLRALFGIRRYATTQAEAAAGGRLRTLDIDAYLRTAAKEKRGISANREIALLSTVFRCAKRWGKTEYNPCAGAERNTETARTRETKQWEYESLLTVATPLMQLMIRFERITGWREKDIRLLHRNQLQADGIHVTQSKRGKRQIWEWTPELRAIIEEAQQLPLGRRIKGERNDARGLYVFHTRSGKPLSLSGFQSLWRRTIDRANKCLDHAQITDLHFHDIRAAAGDDAADQGQNRAAFLGNNPSTAEKHYHRRAARVRPLR